MKKTLLSILAIAATTLGFAQINTFPYTEDFESGAGGWTADNTTNGTWELNAPAGTIINSAASGAMAWVTNATGNYNTSDNSWVQSPEFDFSGLPDPTFSANVWWQAENSWDGANLQTSIDGGATWQTVGAFGNPGNWYTDNTVSGLTFTGSQDGWTGAGGGWVNATHDLTGMGGQSSVYLRVTFGSDASVTQEGFAFDDVSLTLSAPGPSTVSEAGTNDTIVHTCTQDMMPDTVWFSHVTGVTGAYAYVVTDASDNILVFPGSNFQDFDGAPAGNCRVYGLSYTGNIDMMQVGMNIQTATLTDDAWMLSDNYVEIVRWENNVEGGMVYEMGTMDTTVHTCAQDGMPDVVMFGNNSDSTANYAYIITTGADTVLAVSGNMADFDGAPAGECHVWGVSYTGALDSMIAGMHISNIDFSNGCWELSDNYIQVVRWEDNVEGGMIYEMGTMDTVVHTCAQDGTPDVVNFATASTSMASYTYIITDGSDVVLGIPGSMADFDGAPAGNCRVYGVSYNGGIDSTIVGMDLNTVDVAFGCYELSSNFIEIVRWENNVDGATVMEMGTNATEVHTCTQDGNDDIVTFDNASTGMGSYSYIITDASDNILGFPPSNMFNFDGAPAGNCRVYGLSYNGAVDTSLVGSNVLSSTLVEGCFELSSNYIEIVRWDSDVDGAMVEESNGMDTVQVTLDGNPAVVDFSNNSTAGNDYAYVLTDQSGMILDVLAGTSNDFSGAPAGVCHVYGLSYSGDLAQVNGDNISSAVFTNGCYDLSDNWVVINRMDPTGILSLSNDIMELAVYPSPAVTTIQFDGLDLSTTYQVRVINAVGAVVLEDLNLNANETMNVEALESGVYFVTLQTADAAQQFSARFIKQ